MGAVSESFEQRLLDSLQFPFDVSIKSERLNGSCINQSRIHASMAGLIVSIKSSARLSRFAVSVCRTPRPDRVRKHRRPIDTRFQQLRSCS